VLVDSKNISAVQTQAEPVANYLKEKGVQVIIGSVLGTWRSAPSPVEPTGVSTESGGTEVEASREISRP